MNKKLWTVTQLEAAVEVELLQDCQKVIAAALDSSRGTIAEVEKMPASPARDAYLDNFNRALKKLEHIQSGIEFWLAEQD
jgi:hypothetical protein